MYQIIQTEPNEYVLIDRRQPHPSSGYKVFFRIRRFVASHWENGAIWTMVNFSIEKAGPGASEIAFSPVWNNPAWDFIVGKTSWKDVRATLAELLQVAESDIIE